MSHRPLSAKMHLVLRIILFFLLIIAFRVWHLGVIERDNRISDAQKPQKRSVQVHANRGLIVDRFGTPLACNRLRYHASIYYAHIRQLPQIRWKKNELGQKFKTFPRKEHIAALSKMLSDQLMLDPIRIEDLIHSKASLLPHVPFIIKENISEAEFCRLRLLEKDWVGLHAEIGSERFYPQKEVASHILGYMGAISSQEYYKLAKEIRELQEVVDDEENLFDPSIPYPYQNIEEVHARLEELKRFSYSMNDLVGKSGLEAVCDEQLRGFHGKETYLVDIKGNFLKKLPESTIAKGGETIRASISIDLQKFAEELLIEDESMRDGRSRYYDAKTKKTIEQKQPWIKGGAIVAMDPNSGEVLALATHPRFDPNDFIPSSNPAVSRPKQNRILKWFETDSHIAQVWNGLTPLSRERLSSKKDLINIDEQYLTLEKYLQILFPSDSPLYQSIDKASSLSVAIKIQETVEELLYLSEQKNCSLLFDVLYPNEKNHRLAKPYAKEEDKEQILEILEKNNVTVQGLKNSLAPYVTNVFDNRDKLLFVDLCRMLVNSTYFSDDLIEKTKTLSLTTYWDISKKIIQLEKILQPKVMVIFHDTVFSKWREENQKDFLKEKREDEKRRKTYQRPYVTYLDKEERIQFSAFWDENRLVLMTYLLSSSGQKDLPPTLKAYEEAFNLDNANTPLEEKDLSLLATFEDNLLYEFIRSIRSYDQLDRPLFGQYIYLRHPYSEQLEKDLAASFYPKNGYHFARSYAFQQSTPLGSIFKVVTGYAALKQEFLDCEKNHLTTSSLNPLSIVDTVRWDRRAKKGGSVVYAYGIDGTPYPKHYKGGRLPRSSQPNLGQVSFVEAMERSSNPYFALLAGDYLHDPEDLCKVAKEMGMGKRTGISLPGEVRGNLAYDLSDNKTGLYSFAIGQHTLVATPLQAAVMLSSVVNGGKVLRPQIFSSSQEAVSQEVVSQQVVHNLFLPNDIREQIIKGLHLVVSGKKGSARPQVIKKLHQYPKLKTEYQKLIKEMIGKTSTAEFMYQANIPSSSKAEKYKDIWFASVSFEDNHPNEWKKPELVVLVYLRFGDGGKEAAPLAMQVINKYRSIKEERENPDSLGYYDDHPSSKDANQQ